MKSGGDKYLKELADETGLTFTPDKIAYGKLEGEYRGYKVNVEVVSDYESSIGLGGLVLTTELFDSAIGVVGGVSAITVIKLKHSKDVAEPYKINNRTYVDKNYVAYFPPVGGMDGLPGQSVKSLKKNIDRMVAVANKMP